MAASYARNINDEHVVARLSTQVQGHATTATNTGDVLSDEEASQRLHDAALAAVVPFQVADAGWTVTLLASQDYISSRMSVLPVVIVVLLVFITVAVSAGESGPWFVAFLFSFVVPLWSQLSEQ